MNLPIIQFSITQDDQSPAKPEPSRLSKAVLAEATLISSNVKVFLTGLGITGVVVADTAREGSQYEEWGLKGVLVVAVLYLIREIAKRDAKIEKLYERLADDDDSESHPQRHTKRK